MNTRIAPGTITLDTTNPGQVLAACGLLVLADALSPGCDAWFSDAAFTVSIPDEPHTAIVPTVLAALGGCAMTTEDTPRPKPGTDSLLLGPPFDLRVDWFSPKTDDDRSHPLKTWAGNQQVRKIARAAQDALRTIGPSDDLFDSERILRTPVEYSGRDKVEPFYFDARRFAGTALDVGWSANARKLEVPAAPAVELLCLIGLQEFRPAAVNEEARSFAYWPWRQRLDAVVAAAEFRGDPRVPGAREHRFAVLAREGGQRYYAFSFARSLGGDCT